MYMYMYTTTRMYKPFEDIKNHWTYMYDVCAQNCALREKSGKMEIDMMWNNASGTL